MSYDRSEMLLEKARQEGGNSSPKKKRDGKQMSLKETLTMQLKEQEDLYSKMRAVRVEISFKSKKPTLYLFFLSHLCRNAIT